MAEERRFPKPAEPLEELGKEELEDRLQKMSEVSPPRVDIVPYLTKGFVLERIEKNEEGFAIFDIKGLVVKAKVTAADTISQYGGCYVIHPRSPIRVTPGSPATRMNTRKDTKSINLPETDTDYYLSSDGFDVSGFRSVTAFIYATTNKPDQIYIEVSLDGGATWRKMEGKEIDSADFVLRTWNYIYIPADVTYVRLKVSTGDPAPDQIEMGLVRKT